MRLQDTVGAQENPVAKSTRGARFHEERTEYYIVRLSPFRGVAFPVQFRILPSG